MKKLLGRLLSERNLFVIIGLLLVLVCTTGYWVYDRLEKVAERPLPTVNRENRRFLVQDLNNNILKADNLAYTYLYQGDEQALAEFEDLKSLTKKRIRQLLIHRKEDRVFHFHLKKLSKLTAQHFENLELLMSIHNENRVNETMQLVANEMQNVGKIKMQKPVAPVSELPEKKRRIFRKSKEEEVKSIEPSTLNPELLADKRTRELNRKLKSVSEEAILKEDDQNSQRLILEQKNNLLTRQIGQIFRSLIVADKRELLNETAENRLVAADTNKVIVLFCIVCCILISAIFIFMINLFGRSRAANLQLKKAKEKSDELAEAKSRFIATVSHEIRTPLNAIAGFSEQLHFHDLPKKSAEKIEIIRNSAKHLAQITNEVLDFSKLEKDHVHLEVIPFCLSKELHLVQEQFEFLLLERNNKLKLTGGDELPPAVFGDPLRFRQVLINLISNSNKFSQDSTITVTCKVKAITDERVLLLLDVADQGIGLTEEQQQRIFEPFEQGNSSITRKYGGTGLGLSITKQIIEKQGGKISVKSKPNQGTTFKMEIPFDLVHSEFVMDLEDKQIDFSFLQGKTVLIADDEPFNRLLLRSLFQHVNLTLLEAENGIVALDMLQKNHVDIVLLDVRMPEMDGDELMEKLKLDSTLSAIPVIGLTATLDTQRRKEMLAAGWVEVLTKPVQPAVLLAALTKSENSII